MAETANAKAPVAKKATDGEKTKTVKKSFKEMTEKEKVCALIKEAAKAAKGSGYKGINLVVKSEVEEDEDGNVTKEAFVMKATDEGYAKRFKKTFDIKIYPVFRAEENKIAALSDADYQPILTLAKAWSKEMTATKKYGKAAQDLLNACLKLKGTGTVREWDANSVADWTL